MQLDTRQKELQQELERFISSIPINIKDRLLSILDKSKKDGIYVYGGVGRGKTMIIRDTLSGCKIPYKITHFQQFMQDLHKSIHILRQKTSDAFILHKFVESYAKNIKILFIDELEVKDIADAMILKSLISEFLEQDTKIIFTSNTKPGDLYLGGMQREFFMPFIQMIEETFLNFHLDNPVDYRTTKMAALEQKMFFAEESSKIHAIIKQFQKDIPATEGKVVLYGREVLFRNTIDRVLITDFGELFERNLSSADYIEICKSFDVIIVENIRIVSEDETDIAIRLINFIDNAYLSQVILFCSFLDSIEKIYPHGRREKEFQRTISRLQEMNSRDYSAEPR